MKNNIIKFLHFILGYESYLEIFTRFKIAFINFGSRRREFLYFEKSISSKSNIVVIGANTGITTIPFAKGKNNRTIFCYEPLLSNFTVLKKIIKHYNHSNIKAYNIALGNKVGLEKIILPTLNGTRKHGLAHIASPHISPVGDGEKFTVEIDKLDNRKELMNTKIDAIQLVAENYEFDILNGAQNIIKQNKPFIYCELWDNEHRLRTLELIKKYDYQIFYKKNNNLKLYDNSDYLGKKFFFKPNG